MHFALVHVVCELSQQKKVSLCDEPNLPPGLYPYPCPLATVHQGINVRGQAQELVSSRTNTITRNSITTSNSGVIRPSTTTSSTILIILGILGAE